ncbi:MAG: sigma-54 dependent transcriptional regulator [Chitinophagaceae bacterium]
MVATVLIIDDEEQLRKLLSRIISLEGFTVTEANSVKAGTEVLLHQSVDVVLCDVRLPDGNGVEFVKTVKTNYPFVEVILLTAYGNIADGIKAMKNGAFDYIVKGDDNNRIIPLLHQALDKALLQKKSAVRVNTKSNLDFASIIGESKAIKKAIDLAQKIAGTDSTVLLLGETGTGKEVFANAIHQSSRRKNNPLVAINCSAFSKELLEGELFGHKAGAFTGAMKDKKGLIEVADGGTLFLDEIGELNIDLQAKLLRVLENGEFIKLGDTKISKANVRIIAATNRDLRKEISSGLFREDLYYRINVFMIELPSLRERKEDIPELAGFFLHRLLEKENRPEVQIASTVIRLLQQYEWKGNIRELKNVMERAAILVEGTEILPEHLPYEIQQQSAGTQKELSLASVEKHHIEKILQYTGGNKTKAASLLEIGLATLYRKMQEYCISPGLSK